MKLGRSLWGIVLIIVGIIFGLNALSITNIDLFFDGWWTLFIIVPSLIGLISEKEKTGNLIGFLIGVFLLLCAQDVLRFELFWKLLVPTILVICGLSMVFKDVLTRKVREKIGKLTSSDKAYCATFGEVNVDSFDDGFDGAELTAVFGSVKCDLRDSKIKEDVLIKASSIFGGITIYAPKNVCVKVISTSIFGGVENHCQNVTSDKMKTIYVNATCIFGGVEIR